MYDTTFLDYPSVDGIAVIYYFTGCEHNCIDCQNPFLKEQKETSEDVIEKLADLCRRNFTNKVCLSGGDPLFSTNKELTRKICELGLFDVMIYTGYDISEIDFDGFKFIKCGKYDKKLKQEATKTNLYISFASTNQCLYNDKKELISKDGKYYFKGKGK